MADMGMEQRRGEGRLGTSDAHRIELRDAKMWRRETERHMRTGSRTTRCPCTLCLFGRPLLRSTQAKHLRDYGRHPRRRLQEEVSHILRHAQSIWQQTQCIKNVVENAQMELHSGCAGSAPKAIPETIGSTQFIVGYGECGCLQNICF